MPAASVEAHPPAQNAGRVGQPASWQRQDGPAL